MPVKLVPDSDLGAGIQGIWYAPLVELLDSGSRAARPE